MDSDGSFHSGSDSEAGSEGTVDVIPISDGDDDGDQNGRRTLQVAPVKKRKDSIGSRSSLNVLRQLVQGLTDEQRNLVREMGFGGVLDIPIIKRSNRKAALWLLQHVDELASAITIGPLRTIHFNNMDFGKVLGVPAGGALIGEQTPGHVVSEVRKILGISESEKRLSIIREIVRRKFPDPMDKQQRDAFKVAFAICTVTYLLSPPLRFDHFFTYYWCGLRRPDLIPMYDWGKLVQEGILVTAGRVKADLKGGRGKSNLTGCTHGLQVFYLDNLDIDILNLRHRNLPHNIFPRCKVYTQAVINSILALDKMTHKRSAVAEYGRLLPRSPADVCYSRNVLNRASSSATLRDVGAKDHYGAPLSEDAAALVAKVEKFSSKCKEAIRRASQKGDELNKKHAEGWRVIVAETNDTINVQTASIMASIEMFTDAVRYQGSRPGGDSDERSEHGIRADHSGGVDRGQRSATMHGTAVNHGGANGCANSMILSSRIMKRHLDDDDCTVLGQQRNGKQKQTAHRDATTMDVDSETETELPDGEPDDPSELAIDSLLMAVQEEEDASRNGGTAVVSETSKYDGRLIEPPSMELFDPDDELFMEQPPPLSVLPPERMHLSNLHQPAPRGEANVQTVNKKDLMGEFCGASSSAERSAHRRNMGSPVINIDGGNPSNRIICETHANMDTAGSVSPTERGVVCTPKPASTRGRNDRVISPISRDREVAASDLAYREDLDAAALNLNITQRENTVSFPFPARRVKPGKFARSPFVQGYNPPVRAPTSYKKFYDYILSQHGDFMLDHWIISTKPKYTELTAISISRQLSPGGSFDTDMMNIAMRRYQQLDVEFANTKGKGRGNGWRLFIEADFANLVKGGYDLLASSYVRDIFLGDHLTFEAHLCQEFVMPVRFGVNWSTYVWDFHAKHIMVLDPTMNNGEQSDKEIQTLHRSVAEGIHSALGVCISAFFPGWEPSLTDWPVEFATGLMIGVCNSADSGIYALHFARHWTGTTLKQTLAPVSDGVIHARMNLMVDIMGIEGNIGHLPARIRDCIAGKK